MRIRNKAKLNRSIIKDVKSVIGGLYSLNAPYAKGYLFCANDKSIACGMFCDYTNEIDGSRWDYYLDYKTGILDKIS